MRVGRDGLPRNPWYQLMALTGDSRGLSTRFVSLKPHPARAPEFVFGDPDQRALWVQVIRHHRQDLAPLWQHFHGCRGSCGPLMAPILACTLPLTYSVLEATWLGGVERALPASEEYHPPTRLTLRRGPPGWVQPRTLPKTPNDGITMAMHAVLQVGFFCRLLIRARGTDNYANCMVDDLCDVVSPLLKGEIPSRVLFKELQQSLSKPSGVLRLSAAQLNCALAVLDAFVGAMHAKAWGTPGLLRFYVPELRGESAFLLPGGVDACTFHYRVPVRS